MTCVIALPCVDVLDRACVDECPVEAIHYEEDVPEQWVAQTVDNAAFFTEVLPGRGTPLGSPGGATRLGPVPADTPLVAGLPAHPCDDTPR